MLQDVKHRNSDQPRTNVMFTLISIHRLSRLVAERAPAVACVLASFICGFFRAHAAETVLKEKQSLCVMTFNLRYASTNKPNSWPERRPVMRALLEKLSPDLIGTQEGLYVQLKEVAS